MQLSQKKLNVGVTSKSEVALCHLNELMVPGRNQCKRTKTVVEAFREFQPYS